MKPKTTTVERVDISSRIITLREHRVILDADLAMIYGVSTKRLNEQVKRNARRFPEDFMFQLTTKEWADLTSQIAMSNEQSNRSQIATGSQKHRDPRFLSYAFTEHGALMAANVLNSSKAVEMSVYVIRAFVRMRREMVVNETVARRLAEIETTPLTHDTALRDLFAKIRPLLLPPEPPKRRRIGFYARERGVRYGH
jgi:hypothetical protein